MNNINRKMYNTQMCCCGNCMSESCYCKVPDFMPRDPLLANSYVPYQTLNEIYEPRTSLEQGTIFPELDSPYTSGQGYMQLMELYMSEGGM